MKERLIRIDVADAVEQRLVQKRSLDRGLPVAKQPDELFERNGERFCARAFVPGIGWHD
jgi:hypothetical protein